MNKIDLQETICKWIANHPNSYNNDIEEKVYWNMQDILTLLNCATPETDFITVIMCRKMYDRFKFYYV